MSFYFKLKCGREFVLIVFALFKLIFELIIEYKIKKILLRKLDIR